MNCIGPKSILGPFFFWRVESRLCFLTLTVPRSHLFAMATFSYSTFRANSESPSAVSLSVMFLSSLMRISRIRLGYLLNLEPALHLRILNLTTFGKDLCDVR